MYLPKDLPLLDDFQLLLAKLSQLLDGFAVFPQVTLSWQYMPCSLSILGAVVTLEIAHREESAHHEASLTTFLRSLISSSMQMNSGLGLHLVVNIDHKN